MNGVHDMGGTHGHGQIVVEEDEPVFHERWEGRVYGINRGARAAGLYNLDEFRHAQERLPPVQYLTSSYYQRWLAAIEALVRETRAEVRDEALPERQVEASFVPGDRVVTRNLNPSGHTRLPRYARGKRGVVESVHGPFLLPDTNAHHRSLDREPVYTVRFEARELWGDAAEPRQTVSIDLWQSYLEGSAT
ncbi:MAG TPA: nitrile hydratase subunit beta [Candidatus Limnocylindrales bacterium]|nr:nitrile hydratase subunit beta [Candidatus Limnocylindrales bacterium]